MSIISGKLLNKISNLLMKISLLKKPPVLVFLIMIFVVIFGPWLAPYDPLEPKPMNTLAPPSFDHWFGTDNYGFDVFSRVLCAAQIDFSLALIGVIIGGGIGSLLGATAAKGTSRISRIYHGFRAYYNLEKKLKKIGINIKKIS